MMPVMGNVVRLMTKRCHVAIESRHAWDSNLKRSNIDSILPELLFWSNNIRSYNIRLLQKIEKTHISVYSDASDRACGAYTVGIDDRIFHSMWSESESKLSSTRRELKAIEQALLTFTDEMQSKLCENCPKWWFGNRTTRHCF